MMHSKKSLECVCACTRAWVRVPLGLHVVGTYLRMYVCMYVGMSVYMYVCKLDRAICMQDNS